AAHKGMVVNGPSAQAPDIPRELDELVMQLMAKDPNGRPTMPQAANALDTIGRHYWPPRSSQVSTVQVDLRVGEPPPPAGHATLHDNAGARAFPAKRRERRWPIIVALAGVVLTGAALALALVQPWKKPSGTAAAEEVRVESAADAAPAPPP